MSVPSIKDKYTELILDGLTIQNHFFTQKKRIVLVAFGKKTNKEKLIDYMLPSHENERDWGLFLNDLNQKGLDGQYLKKIISDGDHGLKNVVSKIYPAVPHEIQTKKNINTVPIFFKIYFSSKNPKKLRLLTSWILGLLYIGFAHITFASFSAGIPFIVGGEGIRLWASGSIIKTKEMTISGPYCYTRNPLYLGSFCVILGLCVLGNAFRLHGQLSGKLLSGLFLIGSILLFFIYKRTILKEEESLISRFGDKFKDYISQVPRFFPRLTPFKNKNTPPWPFFFKRSIDNGEMITATGIILIISLVYLKDRIFYQKDIGFPLLLTIGMVSLLLIQYTRRTNKK